MSGKSDYEIREPAEGNRRFRTFRNHLMPDGGLPGCEASDTVWTGCDGPPAGSWPDRRARSIGLLSWILVAVLAVWLHLTRLDGFLEAFPLVLGAKILVFLWVLFGVSLLRPVFTRRARRPRGAPDEV